MLKVFDEKHNFVQEFVKYKDLKIEEEVESGDKTLSFTCMDKYHKLNNEMYLQTEDDEYVIKEVPANGSFPQIVAVLNLEDLQKEMWETYSVTDATIDEAARTVLSGTGWTIGYCDVAKRRNAGMMQVSSLGVIQKLCKAFMCEPVFDTIHKTVSFYEQRGSDKGVYFMSGLNLKRIQKKSTSYDYYTRIIPIGQDGLTIEEVNDGKNYLDNNQYTNKVITYIWKDENYTDPQTLMEDAELKLKDMSKPEVSYSVEIKDLANQRPEYSILSFEVGDTVRVIDARTKIMDKQRIKKIVRYPDNAEKNYCEIANKVLSFEEWQQKLQEASDIINFTVADDGRYTGTIKVSDILKFEEGVAGSSAIGDINSNIVTMQGDVALVKLRVGEFEANYIKAEEAELKYATIQQADILSANIKVVSGDLADYKTVVAEQFSAQDAVLGTLIAKDAELEEAVIGKADITLANIDTANINREKVKDLFVELGMIKEAVISEGRITGYLDAVKINASDITTGTLSLERLIIHGSDKSIVYALNNMGELVSKNVDSIDGGVLTERTVTADRIVAHGITVHEITTEDLIGANGWINLAEGTFNYGNQISWDGRELYIAPERITIVTDGRYSTQSDIDNTLKSMKIGARNLIRNSKTLLFEKYYFETVALTDENGLILTDEDGKILIA